MIISMVCFIQALSICLVNGLTCCNDHFIQLRIIDLVVVGRALAVYS